MDAQTKRDQFLALKKVCLKNCPVIKRLNLLQNSQNSFCIQKRGVSRGVNGVTRFFYRLVLIKKSAKRNPRRGMKMMVKALHILDRSLRTIVKEGLGVKSRSYSYSFSEVPPSKNWQGK